MAVTAVALAVIMAGCLSCTTIRATLAVRSFAKDAGTAVVDLYNPNPEQADHLTARLEEAISASTENVDALKAAYEPDSYAFRFVALQQLTAAHQQLNQRIDEVYLEGIDPKPYQIEKRKNLEQALSASTKFLNSLPGTALDQAESAKLTDAISAAEIDDFSPTSILTFAEQPGNKDKFPTLQDMVDKAKEAAQARDDAIVGIEVIDASNFLRLSLEMAMKQEDLAPLWEESKKDMPGTLKKITPASPHYALLKKELARFRDLAKKVQPPTFAHKQHAKAGSKNKDLVMQYQERLKFEGYWNGSIDGEYSESFVQAVHKYQDDRQVTPDGKIERRTIERFNVPMSTRVKQLKLALHKLRHSPTRGSDYFLRVNLGGQYLEVYQDGGSKISRRHRIIIGNRIGKNHTPEFIDEIEKIVVNPPWLVPERIIEDEMLPQFLNDPEWFKKKGYHAKVIMNEDGTVKKVAAVTQPPGRGNALGVVKILFPNKHAVYLHDTPTKYLFKRALRTYSHGCMRLQDPVDMAKYLLEEDKNPGLAEVDELLEKRIQKTIFLQKKVPIFMVYVTVSVNEEGKVVFFTDPYKREEEAMAALTAD